RAWTVAALPQDRCRPRSRHTVWEARPGRCAAQPELPSGNLRRGQEHGCPGDTGTERQGASRVAARVGHVRCVQRQLKPRAHPAGSMLGMDEREASVAVALFVAAGLLHAVLLLRIKLAELQSAEVTVPVLDLLRTWFVAY